MITLAIGQPYGHGHQSKQGRDVNGQTGKKPGEVGGVEGSEGKEVNPQPQEVPRDPGTAQHLQAKERDQSTPLPAQQPGIREGDQNPATQPAE